MFLSVVMAFHNKLPVDFNFVNADRDDDDLKPACCS